MRAEGLRGISQEKTRKTTIPGPRTERPEDLVKRWIAATVSNRLWVANLTYMRTCTR